MVQLTSRLRKSHLYRNANEVPPIECQQNLKPNKQPTQCKGNNEININFDTYLCPNRKTCFYKSCNNNYYACSLPISFSRTSCSTNKISC